MLQDVVDVRAHGRQYVDAGQVAGRLAEAIVDACAVDDQNLAVPASLVEQALERLGLGVLELEAVDDDEASKVRKI